MQTVAQPQDFVTPQVQSPPLVDYSQIWQGHENLSDLTQRLFRLAGLTDPAARAVLAVSSTLPRDGRHKSIAHATIATRLHKDRAAITRYLDELEASQDDCGYQFVAVKRGTRVEKGIFADRWRRGLYKAYQDTMQSGTWSDDWRGGADSPANRCRETVAKAALATIPKIKKEETKAGDEDRQREILDSARRRAELLEPRVRKLFADLEEIAKIDPFIARVAYSRLTTKILPTVTAKADRRIQDLAFESLREAGGVVQPCDGLDDFLIDETQPGNAASPLDETQNLEKTAISCHEKSADEDVYEARAENNVWLPTAEERRDSALSYAAQGRRVLPVSGVNEEGVCRCRNGVDCAAPGKHPLPSEWQKRATTDVITIGRWWAKWRHANIGWLMGNGFLCLDFDGEAGQELYRKMKAEGLIPATLQARTGSGGTHVIFATPLNFTSTVRLLPGLDIRSDRTQIVVEPSFTNKGAYTWLPGPTEPAALPPELFTWLQERFNDRATEEMERAAQLTKTASNGYRSSGSVYQIVPEGMRDNTMTRWLRGRRNSVADPAVLLSEALEKNQREYRPPMPEARVVDMVRRVCRKFQPVLA